jgi:hypothetical protein
MIKRKTKKITESQLRNLIRQEVRNLVKEAHQDLEDDLGIIEFKDVPALVHSSKNQLGNQLRLDTDSERLIPRSFSLGLPGSAWEYFGDHKAWFRITRSKFLVINNEQFYNWGPQTATPLNRGGIIEQWARQHNIDVVLLNVEEWGMDTEYAVINLNVLERLNERPNLGINDPRADEDSDEYDPDFDPGDPYAD